jgi:ribonuclease BN (tRNA processing enzyme)
MDDLREVLFPGSGVMAPKFPLHWTEMTPGRRHDVVDLPVTTPVGCPSHPETHPSALRVEVGNKVIAYSGDGEWTEALGQVSRGADLPVAECYFFARPLKWHLNYPDMAPDREHFGAKRIVLTHMSREMLAHADVVPKECAHDGLAITL